MIRIYFHNRKGKIEHKPPKTKQASNLEASTFTLMAKQHHHQILINDMQSNYGQC